MGGKDSDGRVSLVTIKKERERDLSVFILFERQRETFHLLVHDHGWTRSQLSLEFNFSP